MKIDRLKRIMTVIAAFMISSFAAMSQTREITGTVKEASTGEPAVGASVIVKGTTTGTMVGPDGSYRIKAGPADVLVFDLIGMKQVEEKVEGRASIDVVMEDDSETLEATVVVGYGTLKKTQLVGAVENFSG